MPRLSNQKLKPLYLARILLERTDESNVLTATELIAALNAYGIESGRKAIYDDLEALQLFGLDVTLRHGKDGGYFIASRDFELPELKLLVDAVQSSRFITSKKSGELIGKLSKLTSEPQAKQLKRQVYVSGRAKTLNKTVYYAIDAIHTAINENMKISFKYFDYTVGKRREYRKNGEPYVRTPVALCWSDDNYYLITYLPGRGNDPFAQYRIDRMSDVKTLDESADVFDRDSFDIAEHAKRLFGMYSGETVKATIAFDKSLVGVVLDHFGNDTSLVSIDRNRFYTEVEVSESPVFLSWVFQFGKKAEILKPEALREAMRGLISENDKIYAQNDRQSCCDFGTTIGK
jgi:predicted DNA-binding transcriptional regulator YafY